MHALIDKHGFAASYSDVFGKGGLEWLRSLELPALDKLILINHLTHLESLNQQTERVDEEVHSKASENEGVRLLLSMTGVDVYTALLIKSEIGSIDRFPDYKRLVSWAGLAPSLHQSGSITKQGSRMLRWIMVEAVIHNERRQGKSERAEQTWTPHPCTHARIGQRGTVVAHNI